MRIASPAVMLIMAALVLPTAAADAQIAPAAALPIDGTLLDVVAEGRTTRIPDVATIRAGVVTQAPAAAAALGDNAQRMSRVIAALKQAGVAPRDIATANISLSPQYKYAENQPPVITGYQASNTVSVRFRDIARSGAILDALVAQGANQIDGPSLSLDQPDAALDEARTDAVKRARARAELYARAAGLTVARILSISEAGEPSPGVPSPRYMVAKADSSTPISAGEQDVTVSVSVRFLLK